MNIRRKILIVDDELIEREMLAFMLSDLYDVIFADDGAIALDIIKQKRTNLSLVILDLHMPKIDGYELLKIMHDDNELRRIPAIVLTSEKGAEVKSLQLGASDFITKPYDLPDVIRARVSRSIELAENSIIIHQTERDSLTGLYNKEFFFEYGKRLDAQNGSPMDAIVLDINRFRIINELYGKSYGEEILKKVSSCIKEIAHQNGGLACRSGGNTFGLYLPHTPDLKKRVPDYLERIKNSTHAGKVSIRMGVYHDNGQGLDMERRFDRASLTCRKLRDSCESCFEFYNDEMHAKELFAERLISEMEIAINEKQFKVYYQPKYDIRGEKPVLRSAEALVRWVHPEFGMISPGVFIPLFENNGLIQNLDLYVWNEAAAQIKKWKDDLNIKIPVSVNVSRIDIFNPLLVDILCGISSKNGLDTGDILLEVTESAYTNNSQKIIDTVESLRKEGFKIEMDDFGSGYSSLNMLTSLPIDALKLDMKFIRNICSNEKDYRLVAIMIEIARLLEVPVIAEGVETKKQMELLKNVGCDIIQGYYFSKPLPHDEFTQLIKSEKKESRFLC